MGADEFLDWDTELCDNCEQVILDYLFLDDGKIEEKWICVGTIPKPNDENNVHDLVNKIQICLKDENSKTGITCHQWTPYEAQVVSVFLASAVTRLLYEDQPTVDELKKLRTLMKIAKMDRLRRHVEKAKRIPSER